MHQQPSPLGAVRATKSNTDEWQLATQRHVGWLTAEEQRLLSAVDDAAKTYAELEAVVEQDNESRLNFISSHPR